MSTIKNKTSSTIWVLSDNGSDIWRVSGVEAKCQCTTGQPNQREFKTKEKALAEIPKQYLDLES